jgi:hypothetical protein
VLYLFSGPLAGRRSLELCLADRGLMCDSMDAVLEHDLSDDGVWETIIRDIDAGRYCFLFSSFPCKSSSISRHRADRRPGPGPLRSLEPPHHIWGLPGLSGSDKELVRLGNYFAIRTAAACRRMAALGLGYALEQPRPHPGLPSLLFLPPVQTLLDEGASQVDFDQCMFRSVTTKPTRVIYFKGKFSSLSSCCTHPMVWWDTGGGTGNWASHQILAGVRLATGKFALEETQWYTDELNEALAECIAQADEDH